MSNQTSSITPQAVEPAQSCPVPILDPPTEETIRKAVEVLREHYILLRKEPATPADQSARILSAVSEATEGFTATYRREVLRAAVADMESHEHPGDHYSLHSALAKIESAATDSDKETVCQAIQMQLDDAEAACKNEDELDAMRPTIEGIVNRLDAKAKCLVGMLLEVASVDGVSNINWPNDLMHVTIRDSDATMEGCRTFWDDPDIKTMFKAYRLAQKITGDDEGGTDEPPTPSGGLEVIQELVTPQTEG